MLDHHHQMYHMHDQRPPQATMTTSESDGHAPHGELEMGRSGSSNNLESFNDSGDGSGEDIEVHPNQRPRKKHYHRHTQQHQIQELEGFFKECPHFDDKQRKELSRELGLKHL
ncbi:hypothetical protein GUJ93_ZPchr0006g41160 [Zizania palustris]|uniref:Homeobox domain-containing protein n=1 Tax=Zizania palustris TaxID=103762 RepID=A0A8J5SIH9_ZIZPA|nr:hypothetical protein GUJ93_ZPchr0006g41160 [Zizania palustris]